MALTTVGLRLFQVCIWGEGHGLGWIGSPVADRRHEHEGGSGNMGGTRWLHAALSVSVAALVVGSVCVTGAFVATAPSASAADPPVSTVTTFPSAAAIPSEIAAGADGALWSLAPGVQGTSKVLRTSTTGVQTSFSDPSLQYPSAITAGSDGALWIADGGTNAIWRITTSGQLSHVADPAVTITRALTSGPDGAVWFAGFGDAHTKVGRVTMAGVVTMFDINAYVYPEDIVTGPDGALWFVGGGLVGRITTAGASTLFPDPAAPFAESIASGSDGALWYADQLTGSITRITTSGVRTLVRKADIGSPENLISGPDGGLWYTDFIAHAVRRLTTQGALSTVLVPDTLSFIGALVVGPDDALWFTASASAGPPVIGRVQVLGAPGPPPPPRAVGGTGSATITWAPGLDGGAPTTSYVVTATPGGASCGWIAGPLSCVITGLSQSTAYTFSVRGTSAQGPGVASSPSNPVVPHAGAGFHPVPPTRVLDSRTATGGWGGTLSSTPRTLSFGLAQVPAAATAVIMNVTVTEPSQASYLTVWPSGEPQPVASNLNFATGQTIANLVTVQLGTGNGVSFATPYGETHVVADLVGWFDGGVGSGDRFNAIAPVRALDSRTVTGNWNGSLVAGTPQDLALPMVPDDATAVVANITATGSNAASYLTAWPSGIARPGVSNLNFAKGETIPNLAVIPIGTGHKISFATNTGSTDVVVDVTGWFSPSSGARFHPMTPTRVLDDRFGTGLKGPWGVNTTRTLTLTPPVPAEATALVANVTATNPTANSYVTVFPSGQAVPTASNLNFGADQTIPNLVMTAIGPGHGIDLHNTSGQVDLVADAVGYFAPT